MAPHSLLDWEGTSLPGQGEGNARDAPSSHQQQLEIVAGYRARNLRNPGKPNDAI